MAFSFLKKLFGADAKDAGALPPIVDGADAPAEDAAQESADASVDPAAMKELQGVVLYVVTALVDKPEQVTLDLGKRRDMTVIQVHCFKKDIGKIIGKSGKTITALRTLINSAAARSRLHVTVEVMDD